MEEKIAFHGTSSEFLNSILAQGMLPNPQKRAWAQDPGASVTSQSRVSLPGSYWTLNLMTAISSAQRAANLFGGDRMIIMMAFDPDSPMIAADEDTIRYDINRLVKEYLSSQEKFYVHLDYYTDVLGYIDALEALAEVEGDWPLDEIAETASKLLDQFFNKFADFIIQKFAIDPPSDENAELWIQLLRAHAQRRSSYNWEPAGMKTFFGSPEWRTESYYDFNRYYIQGIESALWQLRKKIENGMGYPTADDPPEVWEDFDARVDAVRTSLDSYEKELTEQFYELQIRPVSSAEAESNYLELLDEVARIYRHWATKEIFDWQVGLRSFRMLGPVGFQGTNRIVAIAVLPKNTYGEIQLVDGDPYHLPELFVSEYKRSMSGSFTVFKGDYPIVSY